MENILCISGVKVYFPEYKPFPMQIALMNKVLKAIQSRENALLESPTGTGKTLALLCSTLSWQAHECSENLTKSQKAQSRDVSSKSDGLLDCNGGDEVVSKSVKEFERKEQNKALEKGRYGDEKNTQPCKIFFASRTQSQLLQALEELKRCPQTLLSGTLLRSKKLKITLLGARQHYCVNGTVRKKKGASIDEECGKLLADPENPKCVYYATNHRLKTKILQSEELFDFEDMKSLAKAKRKGCPYFVSRELLKSSHIVLCPYNYIIDPWIRSSLNLEEYMNDSIVVIDEAHNVETAARDAVSFEISSSSLKEALAQMAEVCRKGLESLHSVYQSLYTLLQTLELWCARVSLLMENKNHQIWTGDEFLSTMKQHNNLDQAGINSLQKDLNKALRKERENAGNDIEGGLEIEESEIPLHAKRTLKKLLECILFMSDVDSDFQEAYRVVLMKERGHEEQHLIEYTFAIWALSGKIALNSLRTTTKLRSLILTSGTLSPLNSFSEELGMPFLQKLEAPHIVDVKKHLWAGVVGFGVNNLVLDSTYRNLNSPSFHEELGNTIAAYLKYIPHGVLVFFPSYSLLSKCLNRWKRKGIKQKILESKPNFFVESNESRSPKALDNMIKNYQSKINEGCIFFCVYRGKLSEGINLKNEYARGIFVVGIPFPPYNDLKIELKRMYQNRNSQIFNGSAWYSQQAWRALNQALGRVIRHRTDYGALVFLDHRFKQERNAKNLPRWMRGALMKFESNLAAIESLDDFFMSHKEAEAKTCETELEEMNFSQNCIQETQEIFAVTQTQPLQREDENSVALSAQKNLKRKSDDKSSFLNVEQEAKKAIFIDQYFNKPKSKISPVSHSENEIHLNESKKENGSIRGNETHMNVCEKEYESTRRNEFILNEAKRVVSSAISSLKDLGGSESSESSNSQLIQSLIEDLKTALTKSEITFEQQEGQT